MSQATETGRKVGAPLLVALVLLLWLGYALRLYRLDYQSLWGDEVIAAFVAGQDLGGLTLERAQRGNQVPLYYWGLHFWQSWTGEGDFALRFLSLALGMLVVPVLYQAGRRMAGAGAGLASAFLGALSPYYIYYSQEARMYGLTTLLSALVVYFCIRIATGQRQGDQRLSSYVGYTIAGALALYSFYFTGALLVAANLFLLPYLLWRQQNEVRLWLASQVAIVALFAPWLILSWPNWWLATGDIARASVDLLDVGRGLATAFGIGYAVDERQGWLALVPALLLLWSLWRLGATRGALLLALLTMPTIIVYWVSFTPYLHWPRYFIAASPAFYLGVGVGLAGLEQRQRPLGALFILVLGLGVGLSLNNYYHDPRYARHDYRSQIKALDAGSLPTDALIINGPPRLLWLYDHYGGTLYAETLPRPQVETPQEVEARLVSLAASSAGLWLMKYMPPEFDPDNTIEGWLAANGFKAEDTWVENITFSFYSFSGYGKSQEARLLPSPVSFGDSVQLVGYGYDVANRGGIKVIELALWWQARRPVAEDYTVFAHVLDSAGRRIGQRDSQAGAGFRPTSSWLEGEMVVDRLGLLVPDAAWPERHHIEVGLYRLADGSRLPIANATRGDATNYVTIDIAPGPGNGVAQVEERTGRW